MRFVRLTVLLLFIVPVVSAQDRSSEPLTIVPAANPGYVDLILRPACFRETREVLSCPPSLLELTNTAERYVVGEAVVGAPNRERAYLILLNLDTTAPRSVQVDVTLPGRLETYRMVRWIPPFGRDTIALHEDPLFAETITAFSFTAQFESAGHVTLVTRPAADLWEGSTIVAGVQIGGGQ